MANIRESLHSKIHTWMKMVGFRLNSSNVVKKTTLPLTIIFSKPSILLNSERRIRPENQNLYVLIPMARK